MKRILLILILTFLSGFIFAQSDEALDELYSKKNAQTLYAALVTLQASGDLDDNATARDARLFLEGSKWGRSVLKDGEFLTKGGFSLLIMQSFDLPKGLMYRILPSKRYALREMLFQEYILGNPYSSDPITSFDVIFTLSSLELDSSLNENYLEESESNDYTTGEYGSEPTLDLDIEETEEEALLDQPEDSIETDTDLEPVTTETAEN